MLSNLRLRLWSWLHDRSRKCANCRGPVPDGRRGFCSDACADDYTDALAY